MRQIVLRPSGVVVLPGGQRLDMAVPPVSQAVGPVSARAPVTARPALVTPLAAPVVAATSVGLVPAAGTLVTSTPADLLVGPEAAISDFTIISLDSGTW
jgi:hypothetical protein